MRMAIHRILVQKLYSVVISGKLYKISLLQNFHADLVLSGAIYKR